MTLRPCIVCGEPSAGSRCPEHRAKEAPRSHVAYANHIQWKRLSQKLRKLSPFCEGCGATEGLTTDHVIPESVAPELAYSEENCRVLCKPCNSRRQARYTLDEAQTVLTRLQSAYRRRPTRSGRDRIAAAERAVCDQGRGPSDQRVPTDGKPRRAMNRGVDALR